MANVKITELTADTNPASTDVLPIVDVSADATKKVTIADLLENAGNGSEGAPAFSFDSDPDTGMLRSGADALGFATGGSERLRIDDSGRLLIGSSVAGNADADNINVAGAGNVGITFRGSSSGTGNIFFADSTSGDDLKRGQIVYDHSGNSMRLHTNAVERIRIDSSGNLGLGSSSPLLNFQVVDYGGFSGNANQLLLNNNTYYDSGNKATKTGFSTRIDLTNQDGSIRFLNTSTSSSANAAITLNERLRIDSSGRVGIGTSSPLNQLHIVGGSATTNTGATVLVDDNAALAADIGGSIAFRATDGTDVRTYGLIRGGKLNSGSGGFDGYLAFETRANGQANTTERLRIDNSGNVGIGTSSPAQKLSVDGKLHITDDIVLAQTNGRFDFDNGNSNGALRFHSTSGNAERMRITSAGNVLLGGTTSPASATKSLTIFNGTAPTGSVANGVVLYAEDVSSSSELKVRDEAGNVTTLSPHNFNLIPEGPSEDMAWSYYSEKDGKRINVDMLKAVRLLEQLTGEQLVFTG